jgi:hypothetical protein
MSGKKNPYDTLERPFIVGLMVLAGVALVACSGGAALVVALAAPLPHSIAGIAGVLLYKAGLVGFGTMASAGLLMFAGYGFSLLKRRRPPGSATKPSQNVIVRAMATLRR